MEVTALMSILIKYPLCSACFSPYLKWLAEQNHLQIEGNDLITDLANKDIDRISRLENLLCRSREILEISENQFRDVFGFSNDLLTIDPEKVHDIIAEPLLVINLAEQGFTGIEKLPRFIKHNGQRLPAADFIAYRKGYKFAVELKTIRMENKPKPIPGRPTGNSAIPYWWGIMFVNNVKTKIEDKNRKVIAQLLNTRQHMDCDRTMLALYTRRLGPSTLMTTENYREEIGNIKDKYPELDFILLKDYFGQLLICPELDT